MLRLDGLPAKLCDGITRREAMRIGGLHVAGLTLPTLLRAQAQAKAMPAVDNMFGRAKNVIWLYLAGGPSQFETFDPKPDAPAEIRGVFNPIATNVPGIQICELLPRIARIADKLAIVRSLSTDDNNHESGGYYLMTGHKYTGPNMRQVSPTDWPCLGSMVKMLSPGAHTPLRSVMLPEQIIANPNALMPGQNGGFMGRRWDPDLFKCDPMADRIDIDSFVPPADIPAMRLSSRRSLLEQFNNLSELAEQRAATHGHDLFTSQALDILLSGAARTAFAIEREPAKIRDRYGRTKWGQSVLLSRRLIEAGVRMVFCKWPREPGDNSSTSPLWDTHARNNDRMKDVLCPQFDVSFSALIEDLDQRGLLDETLVVAIGEMGRTPKFNAAGGRDHWGYVFSGVMAGAGIAGAQVFGSSDKCGMHPTSGRVEPSDITATIFHLLGIDHEITFRDLAGRPMRATEGSPIHGLIGTKPKTDARTAPGGEVKPIEFGPPKLLVNLDFEKPARLLEAHSSERGWRALPLGKNVSDDFSVWLGRVPGVRSRSGEHHVGLGYGLATGHARGVIPQGARIMLFQEVFDPNPGVFTFSVHSSGGANESEAYYRDVFLKNFECRLVIYGYTDQTKDLRQIREYASQRFEPVFAGPYESNYQKYTVTTQLRGQEDNARQLDHGIGVAVIVEKITPGVLDVGAGGRPNQGHIRIDDAQLEYSLA